MSDWSTTWIEYVPGSRCVTFAPEASVREIVKPGPTLAWSSGLSAAAGPTRTMAAARKRKTPK